MKETIICMYIPIVLSLIALAELFIFRGKKNGK